MFLGPRGPLRVPSIPASPLLSAPKIQVPSAALKIIPGPRQTPHMIYYRKEEEDVIYHMVMTNTKTKTDTKTNTKTKTEKFQGKWERIQV